MKRLIFIAIIGVFALTGCKHKTSVRTAPDVKESEKLSLRIERTEKVMEAIDVNHLDGVGSKLEKRYGTFFDLYTDGILGIGTPASPDFKKGLHAFLTYPAVQEAFDKTNQVFTPEVAKDVEKELSDAFTIYKGTFPNRQIPKLYSFVAGFNQSVMIADSVLAIGLDKYLGADYKNYQSLGFPMYLIRKMDKKMIPVDAMYAWASGEFPIAKGSQPLISQMIYEGKLMYLVNQMLPNISDTLLFGFTPKQMKWVNKNEKMMWEILISQKLLFTSERFLVVKMIGESPFTNIYSTEAPGKAAVWQGYRIVSAYMKNTKSTLNDLMTEHNYQKILDAAKYRP